MLDVIGSMLVRLLIDYRSAIIAGGELSILGDELTIEAINNWIEKEKIDKKILEYTQLAEREGRLALVIYKRENDLGLRALPFHQYRYKLLYDEFESITGITYESDTGITTIKKPYLIYMQYAGQEEYSNETFAPPKVGYCLEDIEEIDRELKRWSKINHFFADPTPHFDTDEESFFGKLKRLLVGREENTITQGSTNENLTDRRWKVGEGLVTYKTRLNYVQADMRGIESLDRHIQVRAQRISTLTGFPIFLLYPELMSNRATSKEIASESNNAMITERRKHEELWSEVFKSYCIISNTMLGASFNPVGLYAILPQATATQIQLLVDTYLPLEQNKIISKKTFRDMLPGISHDIESANIDKESQLVSSSILNMGAE